VEEKGDIYRTMPGKGRNVFVKKERTLKGKLREELRARGSCDHEEQENECHPTVSLSNDGRKDA